MAHTPGPWVVVHTGSMNMIVPAMREGMIADLIESDANAHLIVAAPDLRAALADLVQTFHARPDILSLCGPHEHAQIKAACDALNKAEAA